MLGHQIRKQKKGKGTLAVAFLDLAKAFDTVSYDLITKGLIRLGVPDQFIAVVEGLYNGVTTTFVTSIKGSSRETRCLLFFSLCILCSAALNATDLAGRARMRQSKPWDKVTIRQ